MEWLSLIFAVLWAISELLGNIDAVESNSIYQAVKAGLSWVKDKLLP